MIRVAVCAPSNPLPRAAADAVAAIVAARPDIELVFAGQCFAVDGHFAGPDRLRADTLVAAANDPGFDAVWFARGGYGAARIAHEVIARLGPAARGKAYFGSSDGGYLLAALYRHGIGRPVHAPMPLDIVREGGEAAIRRVLGFLAGDASGLEPSLGGAPAVAFNLTTLAMLAGTTLMPDLAGHVVMVEEVSEHLYAVDRNFFHVGEHLARAGIAGLRLGRVREVPDNDRPFGATPEEIARHWCARGGFPFLGRADIGHDPANRIVPFGRI